MAKVQFEMSEKANKKVKLYMINNSINDKRIAINKILEEIKNG